VINYIICNIKFLILHNPHMEGGDIEPAEMLQQEQQQYEEDGG
jgi:hypothetical protein